MGVFENISFLNPIAFLLAALPIGWAAYKSYAGLKEYGRFTFSTTSPLKNGGGWKSKLVWLPNVLRFLAMISLVIALARPQVTLKEEVVKAEGIDIILAMDVSSSMLAKDFKPNRLAVSIEVATKFVKSRPYDRIGLAVFAGEAFTQCPITTDHNILNDFLENLQVGILEDGTAIGMGLATSVNRLKDSEASSKIIILLTDGVNNSGYIDPIPASQIAEEYDVKVYTIGVGSEGTAVSPTYRRSNGTYEFGLAKVQIDEALLQEISKNTGGKYYRAVDRQQLENIYAEIDQLEKTEIEVNVFKRYQEEFRMFLLAGLCFFGLEFLLRNTILKVFE